MAITSSYANSIQSCNASCNKNSFISVPISWQDHQLLKPISSPLLYLVNFQHTQLTPSCIFKPSKHNHCTSSYLQLHMTAAPLQTNFSTICSCNTHFNSHCFCNSKATATHSNALGYQFHLLSFCCDSSNSSHWFNQYSKTTTSCSYIISSFKLFGIRTSIQDQQLICHSTSLQTTAPDSICSIRGSVNPILPYSKHPSNPEIKNSQ